MNSCLYEGTLRHRRFEPVRHEFTYRLFMMYLDLGELPEVLDGHWLWSARRPALAWFRRADYLGDPSLPLDAAVRAEAERRTGRRPEGPVRVLTHLRYLGYVQNPVTFYYCFAPGGMEVDIILAEITNTPWGEKHVYALASEGGTGPAGRVHRFRKAFHVSPFMPMDQRYAWAFNEPARRLVVHMKSHRGAGEAPDGLGEGSVVFDATLRLRRAPIDTGSLASALVRFPWMTLRVASGIYLQAARLWWKGAPFHAHPGRAA